MRCFIAIDIPDTVRRTIGTLIERGRGLSKEIKWAPAGNIHLTLKFLGNVKDELVPEIERRLAALCRNHRPFSVAVRGTGAFPGMRHPRVLWAGMDEAGELVRLRGDVENAMSELGFEKEDRKFSPHLTLARIRDGKKAASAVEEFSTFKDMFFGSIDIKEILLMRSELKPGGAEYTKIAGFQLTGA